MVHVRLFSDVLMDCVISSFRRRSISTVEPGINRTFSLIDFYEKVVTTLGETGE